MAMSAFDPKRTEVAIMGTAGFSLTLPDGWHATEVKRRNL